MFPSTEAVLLEARTGAFAGCISATANLNADLCQLAWAKGDKAAHNAAVTIRKLFDGRPLGSGVKALLSHIHADPALARMKPPLGPFSAGDRAAVVAGYDQVRGKVDIAFEDMGPQALKNIAEPIRVWRAKLSDSEASKVVPEKPLSAGAGGLLGQIRGVLKLARAALASVAAVGAVGLVGYWNVWTTGPTHVFQDGQKTQREAAARPDIAPRSSLAVLPFANLNNDPEQDYFSDGLMADLTTDLAQMPGAFVIRRGTARRLEIRCRKGR